VYFVALNNQEVHRKSTRPEGSSKSTGRAFIGFWEGERFISASNSKIVRRKGPQRNHRVTKKTGAGG